MRASWSSLSYEVIKLRPATSVAVAMVLVMLTIAVPSLHGWSARSRLSQGVLLALALARVGSFLDRC